MAKRDEKITREQKQILVEFMSENVDFARNKLLGVEGKIKSQQLWTVLTNELNMHGSEKSDVKWQRVWTDIKTKVKKKAAGLAESRGKTGGGSPPTNIILSEMDDKIIFILGREAVYGLTGPDGISLETEAPSIEERIHSNIENKLTKRKPTINVQAGPSNIKKQKIDRVSWVELTEELENEIDNCQEPSATTLFSPPMSSVERTTSAIETEEMQATPRQGRKESVAVKTSRELTILTRKTNEDICDIKKEMEKLNSKFDRYLEQNEIIIEDRKQTNEILKNIATALSGQYTE